MKKILLFLCFFLAPVMVFLIGKTDLFNDIRTNVVYFFCFLFALTVSMKPRWYLPNLLLFLMTLVGMKYFIHRDDYIPAIILLLTLVFSWLYNQYKKPGKKNLVSHIFCFQIFGGLVFWFCSTIVMCIWSWISNLFWEYTIAEHIRETIMVCLCIAGTIIGGIIACYDYCECSNEEIRE